MFVSGLLHCPVRFISVFFLTGLYSERGKWMTHWFCSFFIKPLICPLDLFFLFLYFFWCTAAAAAPMM